MIYVLTAFKSGKRIEVSHPKRMNYDLTMASAKHLIQKGCDKVEIIQCDNHYSKIFKTLLK